MLRERFTRICVGSGSDDAEPREHVLEHRHDERHHREDAEDRDDQHDRRVRDGGADLVLELRLLLVVLGKRVHRPREEAARLADPHDADHERREDIGMPRERVRERLTRLDIGLHRDEGGLQLLVFRLLDEDRERPHERQACIQQAGHLAREDRERLAP